MIIVRQAAGTIEISLSRVHPRADKLRARRAIFKRAPCRDYGATRRLSRECARIRAYARGDKFKLQRTFGESESARAIMRNGRGDSFACLENKAPRRGCIPGI